jgi:beta-alanine--pyruvate transaminase
MGAVIVTQQIHDAFMNGPEHLIEFFHGYTYSGTRWPAPPAWHAGHLQGRRPADPRRELQGYWEEALHSLKGEPQRHRHPQHRPGRRIELAPIAGEPTKRAFDGLPRLLREAAC